MLHVYILIIFIHILCAIYYKYQYKSPTSGLILCQQNSFHRFFAKRIKIEIVKLYIQIVFLYIDLSSRLQEGVIAIAREKREREMRQASTPTLARSRVAATGPLARSGRRCAAGLRRFSSVTSVDSCGSQVSRAPLACADSRSFRSLLRRPSFFSISRDRPLFRTSRPLFSRGSLYAR